MKLSFIEAFEKAVIAQNSGQIQEADRIYTALLEADPKHPHANHNMGILGITVGKPEQATPYFKVALESDSTVQQFWISYANNLVSLDRMGQAKKILKKAKKKGVSAQTLEELKSILASPSAAKAAKLYQEPDSKHVEKLLHCLTQEEFEYVLSETDSLINTFPNSAIIFSLRGGANRKLNRYDAAIKSYTRALEIKPDYAEVYFNLGNAYVDIGRLDDAIASFDRAIALEPESADFYINLGQAFRAQDNMEGALICYKKVMELQPEGITSGMHENIGFVYFKIGRYKVAIHHLELSGTPRANSLKLNCLYKLNEKSKFYSHLDYMLSRQEIDPLVGSLMHKASVKYGVDMDNAFCKEPLKYLQKSDLNAQINFRETFIKHTKKMLADSKLFFQHQVLLKNGTQTAGNFFDSDNSSVAEIKRCIDLEIVKYRQKFKESGEGFITHWPKSYSLHGWIISMKSGGELSPHIHEDGWISGSVYINIPKNLENDAGNLVVTLDDEDSSSVDDKLSIALSNGDLCLFPSSLAHYTIPFESAEERIVLAFDVKPY